MLARPTFWIIALVVLAAAVWFRTQTADQAAPGSTPHVTFITGGSGPYWQATVDGANAAAQEHDVALEVRMPRGAENLDEQMQLLARCAASKPDGVAISPVSAEELTRAMNIMATKPKVVTFDSDAPLSLRLSYVGTNNLAAGRLCAQLVEEAVPEGGKVAVLLANLTKDNLIARKKGFEESFAHAAGESTESAPPSKIQIVGYLTDHGDDQKCAENIRKTLSDYPDLKCLVGMNARHGAIMLDALESAGKLGQVKLVTFDYADEVLNGIESGNIYATVVQDPYKYGYEAVRLLSTFCRKGEEELPIVGGGSVYVYAEAVRSKDLEKFRARLRARQKAIASHSG